MKSPLLELITWKTEGTRLTQPAKSPVTSPSTMRALLLIDVIFVLMATPISAWQKICGEQLVETVSFVCSTRGFYSHRVDKRDAEMFQDEQTAKSFLGSRIGSRQRRRTGRIATECCEQVCNFEIVESYCNPWPTVVETPSDDTVPLYLVAPGRVRQDKSVDAAELLRDTANSVHDDDNLPMTRREENDRLLDTLETLDQEFADGDNTAVLQPEGGVGERAELETEPVEDEQEGEELLFPEPIPTKKRRRVEGRRSRENSRDRSGKSEGRSRKKSGSREGGRSSRRRGKSSKTKKVKGRDGREERTKRWEVVVTSHPPTKDIVETLKNAMRSANREQLRDAVQHGDYKPGMTLRRSRYNQNSSLPPKGRGDRNNNESTLAALYNLAVRLARARRE